MALRQAQIAYDRGEVPIGAVIVSSQGETLGQGYNQTETLSCQDQHAEMCAVRAACRANQNWRLDGCTLYVTVQPCIMCLGLVLLSRCERIVYGVSSPLFGYSLSEEEIYQLHPGRLKSIHKGVLAAEAENLMKNFFKKQRMLS